jgi:peptide alpha-N-acetyltransferase
MRDAVLVPELQGQVVGYISCHLTGQGKGQIGLMAIGKEVRGKGIAKSLVYAALRWFAERSVTQVFVVTQGRNVQALRLYQKCGFLIEKMELWYHRWFKRKGVEVAP